MASTSRERYPGEFDDILTVQNDAILEDMGKKMAKVELGESKEVNKYR